MPRIVVLGGGAAGSNIANRLRRRLADEVDAGRTELLVIDRDDRHVYQPGLLFLPFGIYQPQDLFRPRRAQLHAAVRFRTGTVVRLAVDEQQVVLENGEAIGYDVCIIASGAVVAPDETEGLIGPGWRTSIFDFYSLDGAMALARMLASWPGGQLVVNVADFPIKGPLAPLEFACLADWFFTMRGIRGDVDLTLVTPHQGPAPPLACHPTLVDLLQDKGVRLVTDFRTARVEADARLLVSWNDQAVPYDLLVTVPRHLGARFVARTPGLGDDDGFVRVDLRTLQSRRHPAIFAIGDATDLPISKDATAAHFQGEVLAENVCRFLAGRTPDAAFDGHDHCVVETGFERALLLETTYDRAPHRGRYPLPSLGPLTLLEESHLNHLGKMAFRWIYWNVVLPGHDLPGRRWRQAAGARLAAAALDGAASSGRGP